MVAEAPRGRARGPGANCPADDPSRSRRGPGRRAGDPRQPQPQPQPGRDAGGRSRHDRDVPDRRSRPDERPRQSLSLPSWGSDGRWRDGWFLTSQLPEFHTLNINMPPVINTLPKHAALGHMVAAGTRQAHVPRAAGSPPPNNPSKGRDALTYDSSRYARAVSPEFQLDLFDPRNVG